MEKIALITDSACDIDEDTIKKYNIHILPFKIIYKAREYTDKIDITPREIYDNMKIEIPKSSLPSLHDIEKLFEKLVEEQFTHAICIDISSGISGTVNAIDLISRQFPQIKTYIFDTKSTSLCQGLILKKCGELINSGETFLSITSSIPLMKSKLHFYFVFGTLDYAIKGGRIGKISGIIGNILDIKPIVGFDEEFGQCYTNSKIRGRGKSINKLIELSNIYTKSKKCDAYIVHANAEEDVLKISCKLKANPNIANVYVIGQISAIVGVYCGPGTVGVCYSEL